MDNQETVPFGNEIPKSERDWAMFAHLSGLAGYVMSLGAANFAGPLIIWLIKREEMPFVDDQGKEALNFQISVLLMALISLPFCLIFIGFFFLIAVGLFGLIFTIIGAIKAQEGTFYRYPLTIRLIS